MTSRDPGLEGPILASVGANTIDWRSPLPNDDFSEYRDSAFLDRLDLSAHADALRVFWPDRGPQWDALARCDTGAIILVEAKAHIAELCSPGTQARSISRARIIARLDETAEALGARPERADWSRHFYQLANRLAHLYFLRARGVPAWLVLANFIGDSERGGPDSPQAWIAAYQVAWHVMGLSKRHPLSRYVVEVFPMTRDDD